MPNPTPQQSQLTQCSASELLQLYRERKASPVEATRAVLARIDALNPRLNAYCLVAHEAALQTAAASEAQIPVRAIGRVRAGEGLTVIGLDGAPARFARDAYSHF